jgi:UDPglucose 6-dehydrogenase
MRIAVIGTGYVGLVVGACFAETGNEVTCVDKDASKIRLLNRGRIPIYEPGLEELVRRNYDEKRLTFTTTLADPVKRADVIFIAVGTPTGEDGSADLKHVLAAAREIGHALNGYKVIVDKSTVPAGTSDLVHREIARTTSHPFAVVSNPEFLKQGAAVEDFLKPDRVVIGATDPRAAEIMKELYRPFTRTGAPIMVMDPASAELCKYAANAMLATRISFMNEIANVCERFGADVDKVRQAVASDRRIGAAFLFPGVGYGGSCFPKDVKAIIKFSGRPEVQIPDSRRRRKRQPVAEARAALAAREALRPEAEREDRCRVGAGVQAAHRRHARGAGGADHRGAARARREGSRVRSRGEGRGEADLQIEDHLRAQCL